MLVLSAKLIEIHWEFMNGYDNDMNLYIQEECKEYAEKAKALPPTPKDADNLTLYGLFKQATTMVVDTS